MFTFPSIPEPQTYPELQIWKFEFPFESSYSGQFCLRLAVPTTLCHVTRSSVPCNYPSSPASPCFSKQSPSLKWPSSSRPSVHFPASFLRPDSSMNPVFLPQIPLYHLHLLPNFHAFSMFLWLFLARHSHYSTARVTASPIFLCPDSPEDREHRISFIFTYSPLAGPHIHLLSRLLSLPRKMFQTRDFALKISCWPPSPTEFLKKEFVFCLKVLSFFFDGTLWDTVRKYALITEYCSLSCCTLEVWNMLWDDLFLYFARSFTLIFRFFYTVSPPSLFLLRILMLFLCHLVTESTRIPTGTRGSHRQKPQNTALSMRSIIYRQFFLRHNSSSGGPKKRPRWRHRIACKCFWYGRQMSAKRIFGRED